MCEGKIEKTKENRQKRIKQFIFRYVNSNINM